MWRTFLALNLMLCAFVPIPTARAQNCDPGDVGVMGFYPKLFEDVSYGCEEDILVDHLSGGAGRMEIAPSDVHISEHIVLGNNPPSLYTFLADLGDSRTVVFKSHGGPWGFMVMYFADAAARHTAYLSYPANWRGTYITEVDGAPAPGINFTWLGIGALIREASILKSKALVGAFHCNSIDLQANWGDFSPATGRTYVGYNSSPSIETNCENVEKVINGLGCYRFPLVGHQIDDAVRGTTSLVLNGDDKNQLNPCLDCWDWSGRYPQAGAWNGNFYWSLTGEDSLSMFYVRGYRSEEALPETLAVLPGAGTDGYHQVRFYTYPVEAGTYPRGDVVEIDNHGVASASDVFGWGDQPENWQMFEQHQVFPTSELEPAPPEPQTLQEIPGDSTGGGGRDLPSDYYCADAVLYSSNSSFLPAVAAQVGRYLTWQGYQIKSRSFIGSADPYQAKTALQGVASANRAYNDEGHTRVYPYNPRLILVGDDHFIHFITWPDDPFGSCAQPICRSWRLIGDLNGDNSPECAVQVLPAEDLTGVQRICDGADDWNLGHWVNPARRSLLFAGDQLNGQAAPWLLEDFEPVQDYLWSQGYQVVGPLTESSYGTNYAGMMAAGLAAINQGAMLIWLTGLGTGADDLTWFFRTPVEQMVTKQRVLVVAPSCQTNTTWWPPEWAISTAQRAMTNDPEKTLAVGVVGLINGAYGQRHQQFNDLLVDAFQIAAYQTPMADIVQTAALAMGQIDQGYANGIIFFGAHVLKPNSASVDVAEQAPSSMRMLQAVPVGRNFEFRFSLNKAAQITLDVYDIQGRHVSSLASGTLSGGPHVYHWDTAGLASGIYLARLNQGSSTTGVKLVLVH